MNDTFARLQTEVIKPGLCTHCGTCVGLSNGTLGMVDTDDGPLPMPPETNGVQLEPIAYQACPGNGVDFPALNNFVFQKQPQNWLSGRYRQFFIGHANDDEIRRGAASGGVITAILLYLLQSGRVDGAVVLRQGWPKPWMSTPIIAQSAEELIAASQSVYVPTSVNAILDEMSAFPGRLAYVGLPDQVASLRCLQQLEHSGALKVDYVLGPYVGTTLYLGAIQSFLRSNGISELQEVVELRYRDGEWPGHLRISLRSGQELRAQKFYYNYLIPFFVTKATLYSVDFTNELTDISVGDAWRADLETRGGGHSVVVARTRKGEDLMRLLDEKDILSLQTIDSDSALGMHGHMLDFKKRGAFIRIGWRRALGKPIPDYGYRPLDIPFARYLVEMVVSALFILGRMRLVRWIVERIPLEMLGPLFDFLRKSWKNFSKPTKRRGLSDYRVEVVS